jgi:hypothetical protein
MYSSKIAHVKEHKDELKKEFKVGPARTPVKIIGIGNKALKVLIFEASRFTAVPVWKQHWINFEKDVPQSEMAQKLIEEMVKSISQSTL